MDITGTADCTSMSRVSGLVLVEQAALQKSGVDTVTVY